MFGGSIQLHLHSHSHLPWFTSDSQHGPDTKYAYNAPSIAGTAIYKYSTMHLLPEKLVSLFRSHVAQSRVVLHIIPPYRPEPKRIPRKHRIQVTRTSGHQVAGIRVSGVWNDGEDGGAEPPAYETDPLTPRPSCPSWRDLKPCLFAFIRGYIWAVSIGTKKMVGQAKPALPFAG